VVSDVREGLRGVPNLLPDVLNLVPDVLELVPDVLTLLRDVVSQPPADVRDLVGDMAGTR